jgi:hypothetical protein
VNFHPTLDTRRPFYERMIVRDVTSLNTLGRPLPRKVCHRGFADVVVQQGNHNIRAPDVAVADSPGIVILHFPVRTFAQFERKIIEGGAAYARNSELPESVGETWRALYRGRDDGSIRAHYDSVVIDEEHLETVMLERNLVSDRRLDEYMRALRGGRADQPET